MIDAYAIDGPTFGRRIVITHRGGSFMLLPEEAAYLGRALSEAYVRALDPTPLPEPDPLPRHEPQTKPSASLDILDL